MILTFLNSIVFTLIAAITIPILIHLFNKQRTKKILFSSLRFLKLLEKKRLKRLKLYQWLLILLRTLLLLFLIMAFARPTFTGEALFNSGQAQTTAVIILDDGLNMRSFDGEGNHFSRAKDILLQLLQQFKNEDKVFILSGSTGNRIPINEETIKSLEAEFQTVNWTNVLAQSKTLINDNPNFNRELYVISDFKFKSGNSEEMFQPFDNCRIYFITLDNFPVTNCGIDTVIFNNTFFELNKPLFLEIRIRNYSEDSATPADVHLFVNDQRVAFERVNVNSEATEAVSLSFIPRHYGLLNGYVELNDDDLLADNRYYFSINIPEKIQILFVNDTPSLFLDTALNTISAGTNLIFSHETYSSWLRQNLNHFQAVYLSDFPSLPSAAVESMKDFLNSGGSIILQPGMQTIPGDFNKQMSALHIPLQLENFVTAQNETGYFSLKAPSVNDPLFSGLFRQKNPELADIHFFKYFRLLPVSPVRTVLSLNSGDAFIASLALKNGDAYFIAGAIQDDWTDLHYKGLFLPLFTRLFLMASHRFSGENNFVTVGNEAEITLNQEQGAGTFFLRQPNQDESRIVPESAGQVLRFRLNAINSPGHYPVLSGNKPVATISANIDAGSLHQPYFDLQSFQSQTNVKIYSESEPFTQKINEARFGQEFWKLFIILAILAILTEFLLIKKIEGREKA